MKLNPSLSKSVSLITFAPASREKRVAIRRRPHDQLGADVAAGTRAIVDDEWLTETVR